MLALSLLAASLYAIIGGPSAGKTSIINELKENGQHTIEESATAIIKESLKKGIKTPWEKVGFQSDIFNLKLKLETKAHDLNKDVFVDRGLLDNLVYLDLGGKKNSKEYKDIQGKITSLDIASRYKAIFYVEPHTGSEFKCKTSEIRRESTEEAIAIGRAIKDIYSKHYNLIIIPGNMSPKERAKLVQQRVSELKSTNLYAIIGGPSTGKTSIINELKSKGRKTVEEAASILIKENMDKGIKTPWENDGFQTDIFNMKLKLETKALESWEDVYIDRGLLDDLVYLEINGKKDTKEYKQIKNKINSLNIKDRYKAIFYIEPHSKENFNLESSEVRKETTEEALSTGKAIREIYSKYYSLITIPGNLNVKQRAALIETKINELNSSN